MNYLYIAWQNIETREWIPVAKLEKNEGKFILSYTQGANKYPAFTGFGRMNDLGKIYSSTDIFPFFKNRLISKSRPDYKKYISWLGLDVDSDEMELLSISSGSRATDSYEIVAPPEKFNDSLLLKFFIRGISHLPKEVIRLLDNLKVDQKLFLMKDHQNPHDPHATAVRSDDPKVLIGYIPKYYCKSLDRIEKLISKFEVSVSILKNNIDAPLSMKILCVVEIKNSSYLADDFFEAEDNFQSWSNEKTKMKIDEIFKGLPNI